MQSKIEVLASVAILSVLFFFCIYYYVVKSNLLLRKIIRPLFPSASVGSLAFISEKTSGILLTGIIPFILFVLILRLSPSRIGFVSGLTVHYWYLTLLLVIITGILSFSASRRPKVQEISTDLKVRHWYPRHIILSVSAWIIYIFGYEFFFRGVLWFLCLEAFGFWPALLINLLLYSIVHLHKGKMMVAGALPVGLILCLLCNLTGSFFPAFVIHASMAVMTSLFSLYHNPELSLQNPKITR